MNYNYIMSSKKIIKQEKEKNKYKSKQISLKESDDEEEENGMNLKEIQRKNIQNNIFYSSILGNKRQNPNKINKK